MLILLGAIVAGWESLSDDFVGISYTVLNNLLTAVAMSVTKRFSDKTSTTGFSLVYYNALVALPLCIIGATAFNEWQYTMEYPRVDEPVRGVICMWVGGRCAQIMCWCAHGCAGARMPASFIACEGEHRAHACAGARTHVPTFRART